MKPTKALVGFRHKDGTVTAKEVKVYKLHEDLTVAGYHVYYEEKPSFYSDMLMNDPKLGIIYKGIFIGCTRFSRFDGTMHRTLNDQLPERLKNEAEEMVKAIKEAARAQKETKTA